jgi:hypothetical protein
VSALALERRPVQLGLLAVAAPVAGAAAAMQPKLALGLVVAAGLVALTVRAPVISLAIVLFLTGVVPYGLQNHFGLGGGHGVPGLLLSDLLLIIGIGRSIAMLTDRPVHRRVWFAGVAMLCFLGVLVIQLIHGIRAGHDISQSGAEFRVLLGFGTFLIAAVLLDDPQARQKLYIALLTLAILIGLWGLVQWFGHVSFGAASDIGVRQGLRLTSNGTGQLQGGEYGFPVAIVGCVAALVSGGVSAPRVRVALLFAIAVNLLACLVTFERTFWLSTLLGVAFVILRSPARHRARALVMTPLAIVVALVALSALAPQQFVTAEQRLLSVGQYQTDDSVRFRVVETGFVVAKIRAHPLIGSGLAATIFWGQPWAQTRPTVRTFAHNGYAWLAWKLGVPAAALLVLLIFLATVLRAPPGDDQLSGGVRRGAQGALLGLLVTTVAFPSFSALSITTTMGVLLALAIAPNAGRLPR